MHKLNIAIICDYVLQPDRIGGMDRFFVGYDATARCPKFIAGKALTHKIHCFFTSKTRIEFYKDLEIIDNDQPTVEEKFLTHSEHSAVKYDVIITHFLPIASRFHKSIKQLYPKSRLIVVDHNPRPVNGFALKKRLKNYLKAAFYARYVNQWIGVSDYTSNYIIKDLGLMVKSRIQTIYNGIDTSVIPVNKLTTDRRFSPSEPLRLIVVSHLRKSKGIQDAIAAIANLTAVEKALLEVDVYGDGPMRDELVEMVIENDLSNTFSFKGNSATISQLLSNYDYLLQPTYMECFSLSILEALAGNLPVITTTVGGNPEIIEDGVNGFIFEPGQINELEKILKQILSSQLVINKETRSKIENQFTLERMIEEHINLI